jgi:riboflavin kinase/FMN adenylyltransferase
MKIIRTLSDIPVAELGGIGVILVIGVFDGIHAGHRFLFRRAFDLAVLEQASVVAYTFWPYPSHFYAKNQKKIILSPECKFNLLASLGVQYVVEQRFDADFATLSPENFIDLLGRKFDSLISVCVGIDFRFGHNRTGDVIKLGKLCSEIGVVLQVVDEFCMNGKRVSSSTIRTLIDRRNFAAANELLGDEIF